MMDVTLCNEGPVTVILDSRESPPQSGSDPVDREKAELQRRKAEEKQKRTEALAERTRANAAAKAARQAAFEQSPRAGA